MPDYEVGPDGFIVKRDPQHDLGVRMRPLAPGAVDRPGPEDAYDPAARGDYSNRRVPLTGWRRSTRNIFGERVVAGRGGN